MCKCRGCGREGTTQLVALADLVLRVWDVRRLKVYLSAGNKSCPDHAIIAWLHDCGTRAHLLNCLYALALRTHAHHRSCLTSAACVWQAMTSMTSPLRPLRWR